MRRLPVGGLGGTWLIALLLAIPGGSAPWAATERSMRFRPVAPESASSFERTTMAPSDSARAGRRGHAVPAPIVVPPIGIETPEMPEPPEPPEPPSGRTSSGDVVRFGSDITVRAGQTIDGDVVSFRGDIEVMGHVTGNVSAIGGGDVTLGPAARVDGDVVCIGGTLNEEPGSSVGGQRVTGPSTPGRGHFFPRIDVAGTGYKITMDVAWLLVLLLIAWLFAILAPARTQRAMEQISSEPGASFIVGVLLWLLIVPSAIALGLVMAVLVITVIGIPLAVGVALAYCVFFALAAVWGMIVGYGVLGQRLYARFKPGTPTLLQSLIWGSVALSALSIASHLFRAVPVFGFVGGLLTFVYFVMLSALITLGAGAIVRGEYQRRSLQNWWSRMRPAGAARNDMPPPPPPPPAPPSPTNSGAEVIS